MESTASNYPEKNSSSKLFQPIVLGKHHLSHRVVMPALTRMRTEQTGIPGELMVEYYRQRATPGGLIITEGAVISETGNGYWKAPGIYTAEQVSGWKKVTDAIHNKGGIVFMQLFHVGRQSHNDLQPDGIAPVGPSAVEHEDIMVYTENNGWVPASPNRALETHEIAEIINDYTRAAILAKEAGFDGVELHGANGYLIDQFLQNGSNLRTDDYGGSVSNRSRLLLEIVKKLIDIWGKDSVGVRLGPSGKYGDMKDSNPTALFRYVAEQLNELYIAYLHIIEPRINGIIEIEAGIKPIASAHIRSFFKNKLIAAGGFNFAEADAILRTGDADLVAFGRHFIANPDLPFRLLNGLPLNPYDRATFYGGTDLGYTDYPAYSSQNLV
jgi:N-ethylmaleimide reductase